MNSNAILAKLPYSEPFLFVETLEEVGGNGVKGSYTFAKDAFFYQGHFTGYPVTPGVILTECMAQIGVVCLGIYLLQEDHLTNCRISLTRTEVDFYLPVLPGERVQVTSEKIYFRFQKLKCKVQMSNEEGKLVARGEISGMINRNE